MKEFKELDGPIDFKDKDRTFLITKLKDYNERVGQECTMFHIEESNYVIT